MIGGGLLLVTLIHPVTLDLHHHAIDLVLAVVIIIPLLLNEGNIQGMWPVIINHNLFLLYINVLNDVIPFDLVLI